MRSRRLHSAFCILHFVLLVACSRAEPPATATDDTREPIEVEYVRGAELPVHAKPDDASPVLTKYMASEAVSILSKKDDWVEVRTASGSGWARAAELATASTLAAESGTASADNLK